MSRTEMTCPVCKSVLSYSRKDGSTAFRIKTLIIKGESRMVKGVCKKCGNEIGLPLKTAIPVNVPKGGRLSTLQHQVKL